MIIVKLIGGLGNQMFQYAAGRSLAHYLNTEFKLDISAFEHYPDRFYALGNFRIQENFASPKDIYYLSGRPKTTSQKLLHRTNGVLTSFFSKFGIEAFRFKQRNSTHQPHLFIEPHFHFDQNFLNLQDNVYLDGYWQSERYFKDIEEIISKEFTVKEPLAGKNLELGNKIHSCESVSLHIRRGDYVSDPKMAKIHGVSPLEYYYTAIQNLTDHLTDPHFFIFSDDPKWVDNNLHIPHPFTLVYHNGPEAAHEDLRLMSFCKNHIIANSSFSWWGAWLSPNSDKIVITPKRWFNSDGYKTKDLIPDGWIRI